MDDGFSTKRYCCCRVRLPGHWSENAEHHSRIWSIYVLRPTHTIYASPRNNNIGSLEYRMPLVLLITSGSIITEWRVPYKAFLFLLAGLHFPPHFVFGNEKTSQVSSICYECFKITWWHLRFWWSWALICPKSSPYTCKRSLVARMW